MSTPYDNVDKRTLQLAKSNQRLFNNYRLRLATFDELNVLQVKRETKKLYSKIRKNTINQYLISAKEIYPGTTKKMLLSWLEMVYVTVGYQFETEMQRKEQRYFETMLGLIQNDTNLNQADVLKAQKTALRLINNQIQEFGIFVIDKAQLEAFQDDEEEYIRWHTEEDNKVCHICEKRDKKIYPIDSIPSKPHIGCRCYYETVGSK